MSEPERFRVEAEVVGEDYAKILRDVIEETEGCRLTAFDREHQNSEQNRLDS